MKTIKKQQQIVIERHFHGPPNTGNGGYVSGLLAKELEGTIEVTLHKPPPLETKLLLSRESGQCQLKHEDKLIASAKKGELILDIPECISLEEAKSASKNYEKLKALHSFPNCFVCGYQRQKKEGLRIFSGVSKDPNLFAAPWAPYPALANSEGILAEEFIWAALDCPGAFAAMGDHFKPMVLGRITGQVFQDIKVDDQYIIMSWEVSNEGRKHFTGTAIFNSYKKLCAAALSIWFEIDPKKY